MYINPYLAGVLSVLIAELSVVGLLIVREAYRQATKGRDHNGKN